MHYRLTKNELLDEHTQGNEYTSTYHELNALQQHLLTHIAHDGGELYSTATKDKLTAKMGIPATNAGIQSAMRTLSKKGLIFKMDNGVYEIEDGFFKDWLLNQ